MFIAAAERRVMFRIFAAILLTGLSFVALFPFVALLLASFKSASELMRFGLNLRLDFDVLSLKNYLYLFTEQGKIYWTWYKNSLLITLLFTAVSLFFSSLVGYALAVYNFKGKNTVLFLVLFLMMIPLEILMLPLFEEMIAFRLVDTYWGVIVPFAVSPFAVFFFRQYADKSAEGIAGCGADRRLLGIRNLPPNHESLDDSGFWSHGNFAGIAQLE